MRNAWMHSAHTLRGPAAVAATKFHAKVVKGNERNGERRTAQRQQKPWPKGWRQRSWHKLITAGRKWAATAVQERDGKGTLKMRVWYCELPVPTFWPFGSHKITCITRRVVERHLWAPCLAFYVSPSLSLALFLHPSLFLLQLFCCRWLLLHPFGHVSFGLNCCARKVLGMRASQSFASSLPLSLFLYLCLPLPFSISLSLSFVLQWQHSQCCRALREADESLLLMHFDSK